MTYDGNGNPTTYAGTSITYDVENRITAVGSLLTCGYRADGLRAWKQGSTGGKTYFLYDGGVPIIELDSSGNVANLNVFAPDGLVGRKEGSTWSYYTFDQQGNVAQRLDASQAVVTSRVFDAWGCGAETTQPRSIDCWNYNAQWGYYNDRETGLYYCQNRMYDASTGRWINRDPIGYAGGVNLYGYCGGGPVGGADPSGLWKTGSYLGDVGQVLAGYADVILTNFSPSDNINRIHGYLSDPIGTYGQMWEGLQFWNTDDPREFGRRFLPWIPLIAGACELVAVRAAAGAGAAEGAAAAEASLPEVIDVVTPGKTGTPGTIERGFRTSRRYGADGNPKIDRDWDTTHRPPDHAHDWIPDINGGFPNRNPKHRPPADGDTPRPRNAP